MLCDRESLLTNNTRLPTAICTLFGLTPDDVIVMVLVETGGVVLEGEVDEPPHDMTTAPSVINATARSRGSWTMLQASYRGD
jgi:hypothetical protein